MQSRVVEQADACIAVKSRNVNLCNTSKTKWMLEVTTIWYHFLSIVSLYLSKTTTLHVDFFHSSVAT